MKIPTKTIFGQSLKDEINIFFGNLAAFGVVATGVLLVLALIVPPVYVFFIWYFKMWVDALP